MFFKGGRGMSTSSLVIHTQERLRLYTTSCCCRRAGAGAQAKFERACGAKDSYDCYDDVLR